MNIKMETRKFKIFGRLVSFDLFPWLPCKPFAILPTIFVIRKGAMAIVSFRWFKFMADINIFQQWPGE